MRVTRIKGFERADRRAALRRWGRDMIAAAVAATVLAGASVVSATIDVPVEKTTLANGLTVLVHEDRDLPVVSLYLFFRTGSRNERHGITGISHLFEHMMFNGGEHTVGKFDEIIEGNGGSTNGYTTRDFTAYLESFPPPALERVLWLEADRMRALAITPKNLEQERGIVKEERRLRTDDDPGGKIYEEIYLLAYNASTYRWGPIGFMSDIDAITLEDAKSYFRTHYAPNNATLVLGGAVSPQEGFALAERYFGDIPAQTPPLPVVNVEPPQGGPKRLEYHKVAELPAVAIAYKAVNARHADRPALDVLQTILGHGQSSRLYRAIVREKELASDVDVSFNWGIDQELFWLNGQVRPGKTAKQLAAAIEVEIAKLRDRAPDERELRKAKNILQADYVRGLSSVSGKANQLGFYEIVFGDYREMFKEVDRVEAVTAADVQRVARTYLIDAERTTVELVPERPPPGAPPPRPMAPQGASAVTR
ncbi:MAG: peptidase domain protein [Deltaproteobacteria bacterium]|nr:peptidase domain protein [Deltaproteobacteria bacterium]